MYISEVPGFFLLCLFKATTPPGAGLGVSASLTVILSAHELDRNEIKHCVLAPVSPCVSKSPAGVRYVSTFCLRTYCLLVFRASGYFGMCKPQGSGIHEKWE